MHSCAFDRYTYGNVTGAVYGILLAWPDSYKVTFGAIETSINTKITLLGYGEVQWKVAAGNELNVTLPYLPLDSKLQWAWTLKLTNVTPI